MPKHESQVHRLKLQCDECGIVQEGEAFPKDWYEVEMVENAGFRMMETVRVLKSFEASNILKRDILTFCSLAHIRAYMYRNMDNFIAELKPPHDRSHDTRPL